MIGGAPSWDETLLIIIAACGVLVVLVGLMGLLYDLEGWLERRRGHR